MAGEESHGQARRKAAMAVLAHSEVTDIAGHRDAMALPAHEDLREPENGLVMVRCRVGGDGAPFNLGEATVSRAAVRLSTGELGFGYTLGRDRHTAALIEKRNRKSAEAAATRVDFYTLVRGEG